MRISSQILINIWGLVHIAFKGAKDPPLSYILGPLQSVSGEIWFREAETESEIVEPNRKASIGYLAYMVK